MNNASYPYSENDLLLNPEKYEMSPYYGIPFLISYVESRKLILTSETNDLKTEELIPLFSNNINVLDKTQENFSTYDLFIEILKNFLLKNFDPKIIFKTNVFVKKFEIQKKFFTNYNCEFKETTSNFLYFKNYIIFAIICNILYEKTSNLKYLNVSLKLNDLICSQIKKLDQFEKSLAKLSVKNEIDSVRKLSEKKGFEFL